MAGLLSLFQNPEQAGMLGISTGLLNAGGPSRIPVSFGQAMGSSLLQGNELQQAARKANLSADYLNAQTHHIATQDKLTEEKLRQAAENDATVKAILQKAGLLPSDQTAPVSQPGVSSLPGIAAGQSNPAPTAGQPASGGFPLNPSQIAALRLAGQPDLTPMYNAAQPNAQISQGVIIDKKTGKVLGTTPQVNRQGLTTQVVQNPDGSWSTVVTKGSEAALREQERIKQQEAAAYDLVNVPDIRGGYVQMTRQQAADLYSGRVAPQPVQSPATPAQAPQTATPPAPSVTPTLGTQPPPQQIAGQKALNEQFAKDYATWTMGAGADAAKQLAQLQDVVTRLKDVQKGKGPRLGLTGPTLGSMPDKVLNYIDPQAVSTRERVEEVIQRSLRTILGAAFTENEGKRLIARAYNPSQPEKENQIRVQRLLTQLKEAFNAKQSAIKYFQKNGTLEGWQGKLYSMSDFNPEGEAKPSVAPDSAFKVLGSRPAGG